MTASELARLQHRAPRSPFGSERRDAASEIRDAMAEAVEFTAARVWDVNECLPPCCPRALLFHAVSGEFVYLESWSMLPFTETLGREAIAVRSPLRKELISFVAAGEDLRVEAGFREALFDLGGRECEVYALKDLPPEFLGQAKL